VVILWLVSPILCQLSTLRLILLLSIELIVIEKPTNQTYSEKWQSVSSGGISRKIKYFKNPIVLKMFKFFDRYQRLNYSLYGENKLFDWIAL